MDPFSNFSGKQMKSTARYGHQQYLWDSPLAGQARLRHTAGAQLCSRSSRATGAQWGQGDDVSSLSISTCWKDVIGICLFYSSYPRWRHSNKHCQFWYLSYNFLCVFFLNVFLGKKKYSLVLCTCSMPVTSCMCFVFHPCRLIGASAGPHGSSHPVPAADLPNVGPPRRNRVPRCLGIWDGEYGGDSELLWLEHCNSSDDRSNMGNTSCKSGSFRSTWADARDC